MLIFKRPIITILFLYIFIIILFEYLGFFKAQNNSFLIYNINQKNISVTGKVLEQPIIKNEKQQFIFEVNKVNDISIKEKTLVTAPPSYNINYGDIFCLTGHFSDIEEPVFPNLFNYKTYLQREKIYTKFYVDEIEYIENKSDKIKQLSLKVKQDINSKIEKYFKEPVSLVLKSMLIGEKSAIDSDIKDDFINSGLIHILVISGLHIGFVVAIFLFVFKLFNLPLKAVYILTIPAIFFYAILTGSNPPAIRATIMASCILLSLVLDRESLIYNSICLAALIILIYNPQYLFTASMQLSFVATIGIIYFYPKLYIPFSKIKNKFCKYIIGIFCVTLAVQFSLIPLLIFYFGKISIVSFMANILIIPFVGFVVALSFLFYAFTFISNSVSFLISFLLSQILNLILFVIHCFANLNFAVLETKIPSVTEILLYYLTVVLMFKYKEIKNLFIIIPVIIVIMCVIALPSKNFYRTFENKKNLTIHIRQNYKDSLFIKEKRKDKFYYSNLQQYLLFDGIKNIDKIYTDKKDIKELLPKININKIYELKDFKE